MNPLRILNAVEKARQYAKAVDASQFASLGRFAWLTGIRGFSPMEVFSTALLDPSISWRDLQKYQSKESVWRAYAASNEHPALSNVNDKYKFYLACKELGLPTLDQCEPLSPHDVDELIRSVRSSEFSVFSQIVEQLPAAFIAKPSLGFQGQGAAFFRKEGRRLRTWQGETISPVEFLLELRGILGAPTMGHGLTSREHVIIIQEIGFAHPRIAELTGRELMQTVRICTFKPVHGSPVVLYACLRLLTGTNLVDNFRKGSTGNLLAYVDRDSGMIYRAIGRDAKKNIIRVMTHHPDSRSHLVGFPVPFWNDALQTALKAAAAFRDTRAIAWDIGITLDGPVILEANGTWNPGPMYQKFPIE